MNLIEEIEEFLSQTVDGREMKRAIAVKMQLKGKSYHEIQELIGVSQSFISKWKNRAIFEGVDSLRVQYQGGKGKLAPQDKQAVIQWLTSQKKWNLEKLRLYLKTEYGVIFHSLQSYYSLFKEAKITWKKTQKKNPKKNLDLVLEVREEIKKN
jgi:putative transposase